MKRLAFCLVSLFLVSCASSKSLSSDGEERGASSSGSADAPGLASPTAEKSAAPADVSTGNGQVPAGSLTAGTWDDNKRFEQFLAYRSKHQGELFPEADHTQANQASAPGAKQTLDVSLVVDTTGSMGDELTYLKTEFLALHDAILARYPNAQQRWSLILYRDQGDEYVTRWFVFRDDPNEFLENLKAQSADGGGDFPEAPEKGFEVANQLEWRTDANTARLLFWVADAPSHPETSAALAAQIKIAVGKDIHIYSVAASGVDSEAEFQMRSASQLSQGRYIFLTDDSGLGNAHAEPTLPCYFVTRLDKAILRMVDIEMSGTYKEPPTEEIIRQAGVCDGQQQAF